ncbi:MAG: PQQ-binding-like beta-propeller repeat protein [Polaribacter sp.]|uniref:outer membrane protein assembly factor BamB family protein n=1 Tax=Polaribacter sp. TaxID=1920175 RepID=UPI0032654AFD
MKKNLLITICVCMTNILLAQEWTKDFPKKINLVKMSDVGVAIVGTDDALYGINETGKVLWKNEKLRKVEAERVQIISGSELIFVSDKGLLSRNRVLDVNSGKELANSGKKGDNIIGVRLIHGTNQLWALKGNRHINTWNLNNNTIQYGWGRDQIKSDIAFDKMASLTYTFTGAQPITYTSANSAIIHLSALHLANVDLSTGKDIWRFNWKPFKTKDAKASTLSNGYSSMKIDEDSNTLYFPFKTQLIAIDINTGQPKWDAKKGGKTGKVLSMFVTQEGVLALTPKGLQLVDKSTGNLVWKKPIKIKNAIESILLKDEQDFFAISKGSIIKIDVANKKTKVLTEKIKFSGKESFNSLEIIDDLIVLSSSQNIAAFNKQTGDKIHHTYLKAPGSSILKIAQNITLAAVAVAATANSQNINSNNTSGSTYRYHSYTPAVMKSGGSATKSSGNIMYISTKFKDADAKGFGIAKVNKTTGKIVEKIVIGDRDPLYAINHNKGKFFYKSDKKTLSMKSLK